MMKLANAQPRLSRGYALPAILLVCAVAHAQTAPDPGAANPTFEVATIKPSNPESCCDRTFGREGRHFNSYNTNLKWLVQYSYALQASQVIGGPPWFDEIRYDISGTIDGQYTPTPQQWLVAVQNLLADRFQLKFHHETRELPAYVLTIAKGGAKLQRSQSDRPISLGFGGSPGHTMRATGSNATLAQFLGQLQRLALDRPIVDHTGLTGAWNIQLTFTREAIDSVGRTELPDDAAPNLFNALEQQLGLKLEPAKTQVDVLVIDHAEKPSEN
jgi:uncharacterized protein (TIGR03435 family)